MGTHAHALTLLLALTVPSLARPQTFLLRATQLLPHTRYTDTEHHSAVQLSGYGECSCSFGVRGGGTLEVTIAQFWSRWVV